MILAGTGKFARSLPTHPKAGDLHGRWVLRNSDVVPPVDPFKNIPSGVHLHLPAPLTLRPPRHRHGRQTFDLVPRTDEHARWDNARLKILHTPFRFLRNQPHPVDPWPLDRRGPNVRHPIAQLHCPARRDNTRSVNRDDHQVLIGFGILDKLKRTQVGKGPPPGFDTGVRAPGIVIPRGIGKIGFRRHDPIGMVDTGRAETEIETPVARILEHRIL